MPCLEESQRHPADEEPQVTPQTRRLQYQIGEFRIIPQRQLAQIDPLFDVGRQQVPEPVAGRYVVVWLTALPAVDDGFRGEVAEVSVLGTPGG